MSNKNIYNYNVLDNSYLMNQFINDNFNKRIQFFLMVKL